MGRFDKTVSIKGWEYTIKMTSDERDRGKFDMVYLYVSKRGWPFFTHYLRSGNRLIGKAPHIRDLVDDYWFHFKAYKAKQEYLKMMSDIPNE